MCVEKPVNKIDNVEVELSLKTHNARELLGKHAVAQIKLDNETYLLRITKQNKLILTK